MEGTERVAIADDHSELRQANAVGGRFDPTRKPAWYPTEIVGFCPV